MAPGITATVRACSPGVLLPTVLITVCFSGCSWNTAAPVTHCCSAGYSPPRLSPARSSSLQSTASDDLNPDPPHQQPPAASSPPEQGIPGQDSTALQAAPQQAAAAQQSRTVSGSFSSMSVEKGVSSGSIGFADASGMHHHHLQVLCCLSLSRAEPMSEKHVTARVEVKHLSLSRAEPMLQNISSA